MYRLFLLISLSFKSVISISQSFKCEEDSILMNVTKNEYRIIDSVKCMLDGKGYLGHKTLSFYESRMKKWDSVRSQYLTERLINLVGVGYRFSDNLMVCFYFEKFSYVHTFDRKRRWSMKVVRREIPTYVKVFYKYQFICTTGSKTDN